MSNFTNSPMVVHTNLSPHRNSPRNQPIRKITIHHFAGTGSIEAIGNWLARPTTRASYNYGIGNDGRVALYVNERDRCWGSSSAANDHQAVVIGVANSATGGDWPVSERAFEALIELCIDICRRNGIRLEYTGNASGTLTRHNMFAATACPGRFLQNRFPEIAQRVNAGLSGGTSPPVTPTPPPPTPPQPVARPTIRQGARGNDVRALQELLNTHGARPRLNVDGIFGPLTNNAVREFQTRNRLAVDGIVGPRTWGVLIGSVVTAPVAPQPTPQPQPPQPPPPPAFQEYRVRMRPQTTALNVRSGAGTNNPVVSVIRNRDVHTVIAESNGTGANRWGRVRNSQGTILGWIALDFTQRV